MEDKRAYLYRYDTVNHAWGFIPIPGSDIGTEKASLRPIETWTTSKGEVVTLNDAIYSLEAVNEMLGTKLDLERGILYTQNKPPSPIVICIAEEERKDGDLIVCMVKVDLGQRPSITLISRNHSQGCEPRYGSLDLLASTDRVKDCVQNTAILNVVDVVVHNQDWKLTC